jgi:hypothetical protein
VNDGQPASAPHMALIKADHSSLDVQAVKGKEPEQLDGERVSGPVHVGGKGGLTPVRGLCAGVCPPFAPIRGDFREGFDAIARAPGKAWERRKDVIV